MNIFAYTCVTSIGQSKNCPVIKWLEIILLGQERRYVFLNFNDIAKFMLKVYINLYSKPYVLECLFPCPLANFLTIS